MDLRAIGMGVLFAAFWSSAFATAHVIVAHAPPLTALALRFLISGLIAVGLALFMRQSWRLTGAQWRATFLFGLCQNGLYLGLNFVALQTVDASLAAIIASAMPLLVALLGWMIFGQKLRPLGLTGLVLGIAGVALIMGARLRVGLDLTGAMLCVVGALALAIATLSVRSATSSGNLLMVVGLQMLVGSVILAGPALVLEPWQVTWSASLVASFAYQIFGPGLAATLIWFALVQRIGAVRAATFHFLNPFFGVVTAALLLGEPIRLSDIAGVGVIMAGILMAQLSRQSAPYPRPTRVDTETATETRATLRP